MPIKDLLAQIKNKDISTLKGKDLQRFVLARKLGEMVNPNYDYSIDMSKDALSNSKVSRTNLKLMQSSSKNNQLLWNEFGEEVKNTKAGVCFQKHQMKLQNFLEINKAFNECQLKNDENQEYAEQRSLKVRLINIAGQVNIEEVNCADARNAKSVYEFMDRGPSDSQMAVDELVARKVSRQLFEQSMVNQMLSYIDIKSKYVGLGKNDKENLINEICQNKCDKDLKEKLDFVTSKELKKINFSQLPYRSSDVKKSMNNEIRKLNATLAQVEKEQDGIDDGYFQDSIKLNQKGRQLFDLYRYQYNQTVSNPKGGVLLMTDTFQDHVGMLQQVDSPWKISNPFKKPESFNYDRHKVITNNEDVSKAITEAVKTIKNQAGQIIDESKDSIWDKRSLFSNSKERESIRIQKYMKTNPAAAGMVLLNNPSLSKFYCNKVEEIANDDRVDAKTEKVMAIGGLVVGGVLLATGVGAAFGTGIIAASLGTATVVGSLAVGGVEVYYYGDRAIDKYSEAHDYRNALISGNGDSQTLYEARESYDQYKDARFATILSAVGFGIDGLTGAVGVMRLNNA